MIIFFSSCYEKIPGEFKVISRKLESYEFQVVSSAGDTLSVEGGKNFFNIQVGEYVNLEKEIMYGLGIRVKE